MLKHCKYLNAFVESHVKKSLITKEHIVMHMHLKFYGFKFQYTSNKFFLLRASLPLNALLPVQHTPKLMDSVLLVTQGR